MNSFHPHGRDFSTPRSAATQPWLTAKPGQRWFSRRRTTRIGRKSGHPALEVFPRTRRARVEALCACIIPPSDRRRRAKPACSTLIDRALKTFFSDALPVSQKGLRPRRRNTAELFPALPRFPPPRKNRKLKFSRTSGGVRAAGNRRSRLAPEPLRNFFQTLRVHYHFGFRRRPGGGGARRLCWMEKRSPEITSHQLFRAVRLLRQRLYRLAAHARRTREKNERPNGVPYKPSDEVDFVIMAPAAGGVLAKEFYPTGFRVVGPSKQGEYLREKRFPNERN